MKVSVQGWVQSGGGSKREPMRPEVLDAPDGVTAAKDYARRHGVRDQDWWNVGPSPRVVIRTEEVESPTRAFRVRFTVDGRKLEWIRCYVFEWGPDAENHERARAEVLREYPLAHAIAFLEMEAEEVT